MKNILLVFTGGTIGSTVSNSTINTSSTAPRKLLSLFQQQAPNHRHIHFCTIEPLQLLSENLVPDDWQTLITAIEAQQIRQFDGIIITHGTDTLAYTAAALSFYFNAIDIPLLLVASDYPLDDARANGLGNFICAVEFIRQQSLAGVFVPYRNQQQVQQVHKGTRLACSLQLGGDFFSVQNHSFMRFENQAFMPLTAAAESVFDSGKMAVPATAPHLQAHFSKRILMLKPYPGLNYDSVNLDAADAVLHDLYHSGTACTASQWGNPYSSLAFIKRCQERNIKVYLAPAIRSAAAYHSTQALIGQGGIMIWNMSIEAAYAKLMLAYGNFSNEQQILAFMERDIAGEHL